MKECIVLIFFGVILLSNEIVCNSACGPNWIANHATKKCYRFVETERNWFDARQECADIVKREGNNAFTGDLVSIHSGEEQLFIEEYLKEIKGVTYVHIGFTNIKDYKTWLWSDGSPVNFTNWKPGEPNNWANSQHCGEIVTGSAYGMVYNYRWNDLRCNIPIRPSLCEKIPTAAATYALYFCEDPWILDYLTGKCYRIMEDKLTWAAARTECNALAGEDHADLASITTSREQLFIENMLANRTGGVYWMGYNDNEEEGKFVWSDGSAVTYTNWHDGQPDNQNNEDCGCLWDYPDAPFSWNDCPCWWGLKAVCQKIWVTHGK